MIKYTFLLFVILLAPVLTIQADNLTQYNPSVIPHPVQIVPGSGEFGFSGQTIFSVENVEQMEIVRDLAMLFTHSAGFTPIVTLDNKKGNVCLITDRSLKSEAYELDITPQKIVIKASCLKCFIYAIQTLR